jgi:ribonuclease HII
LKKFPNFSFEKKLWRKGFKFVVGVDEVGRGAWAGPLVVAAVVFPPPRHTNKQRSLPIGKVEIDGVDDSKLLKPRLREKLAKEIKKRALVWDVSEVGVGVINRIGIGKATEKAMRKTLRQAQGKLPSGKTVVLIDYFSIPYLRGLGRKNQLGIKDGDKKSFSIASASILAKVHRDKIMRGLARNSRYKVYDWGKNKGYGTKLQQKAIFRYGLTQFHRKQFVKTWKEKKRGVH